MRLAHGSCGVRTQDLFGQTKLLGFRRSVLLLAEQLPTSDSAEDSGKFCEQFIEPVYGLCNLDFTGLGSWSLYPGQTDPRMPGGGRTATVSSPRFRSRFSGNDVQTVRRKGRMADALPTRQIDRDDWRRAMMTKAGRFSKIMLIRCVACLGLLSPLSAQEPKLRATLKGHTEFVYSVAFSPDGKTLASVSFGRTVKLWDVATGKEQASVAEYNVQNNGHA